LFQYVRAESVEHAVAELDRRGDEAAVLAGGQSLIALMNLRLATPGVVVDVGRLGELDTITLTDGTLRVGAMVRARRAEHDDVIFGAVPVLREAIRHIGHPQIRSRTTLGGNVAHGDPASELPAVLVGLDGEVTLTSRRGDRVVASHDFFLATLTTARRSDELVTAISVPIRPALRCRFVEFARRPGDYALAGALVGVALDDGMIADCRISLCGVADTPVRLRSVEAALVRSSPEQALAIVGDAVREAIDPRDEPTCPAAYRRHLAGTVAARALRGALDPAATGRWAA